MMPGLHELQVRSCYPTVESWLTQVVVGAEMPDLPCSVVRTNMDLELGGRSALTAGARMDCCG